MKIPERIIQWAEPRASYHLDQLPPVTTAEEVREMPVMDKLDAACHWWAATFYLIPATLCRLFLYAKR